MKRVENTNDCIEQICPYPETAKEENLAPAQFFRRSKYKKFMKEITAESIIEYMNSHEHIVEMWKCYSLDKRWTPAWGIDERDGRILLFYLLPEEGEQFSVTFESQDYAVAVMILMEMEQLRVLDDRRRGAEKPKPRSCAQK